MQKWAKYLKILVTGKEELQRPSLISTLIAAVTDSNYLLNFLQIHNFLKKQTQIQNRSNEYSEYPGTWNPVLIL